MTAIRLEVDTVHEGTPKDGERSHRGLPLETEVYYAPTVKAALAARHAATAARGYRNAEVLEMRVYDEDGTQLDFEDAFHAEAES